MYDRFCTLYVYVIGLQHKVIEAIAIHCAYVLCYSSQSLASP